MEGRRSVTMCVCVKCAENHEIWVRNAGFRHSVH